MKKQITNQHASNVSTRDLRCVVRIAQPRLITLLLCILIIYGCSSSEDTLKLPFNSDIITPYYYTVEAVGEYILKSDYQKKTVPITPQEASVSIKGWQFAGGGSDSPDDYSYYEIGNFKLNGYLYKLIIYNCYGVSGTKILNIQLNSYTQKGDLQDALILEYLFGYEENDFFSKFTVDNSLISLDFYCTQLYDYDLPGDARIENPVPEIYLQERYQIDNGFFKLVHREETDVFKED